MADLVKYCEICFRERKEYCEKNNSYRFSTDRTGEQFLIFQRQSTLQKIVFIISHKEKYQAINIPKSLSCSIDVSTFLD